jgi:hypothetical protein
MQAKLENTHTYSCIYTQTAQVGCNQHDRIEGLLERVKKLRIGDRQIFLETQKIPYSNGTGDVPRPKEADSIWHSIEFIPVIDPATGKPAILVIEDDISQLEQMKRAEQELQASQAQQEQFFAAGLSICVCVRVCVRACVHVCVCARAHARAFLELREGNRCVQACLFLITVFKLLER